MTLPTWLIERFQDRQRHGASGGEADASEARRRPRAKGPTTPVVAGSFLEQYRPVYLGYRLDPRVRLMRDTAVILLVVAGLIYVLGMVPKTPTQAVLAETNAPTQLVGQPLTGEPSGAGVAASAAPGRSLAPPP